jgi:biopolymer transport protein ExbD
MSTPRKVLFALAVIGLVGMIVAVQKFVWIGQGKCQLQEVDELVAAIEAADPQAHPELIAEGLPSACELPDYALTYIRAFRPSRYLDIPTDAELEERRAAFDAICPESEAMFEAQKLLDPREKLVNMFERCDLDRFGVVSRAEYELQDLATPAPWAIHQWLLDQGLSPAQARPLTAALLTNERASPARELKLSLPRHSIAATAIHTDGYVHANREELSFEWRTVAMLDDGALEPGAAGRTIPRLFEDLAEAVEPADRRAEPLLLAFDEAVRFSTLIAVQDTAGRLGFAQLGLLVDAGAYRFGVLPIEPLGPWNADERPKLELSMGRDGYRLSGPDLEVEEFAGEDLRERALHHCGPDQRAIVISGEPELTIAQLSAALVDLRGPACRADGSDCCFVEIMVETPTE